MRLAWRELRGGLRGFGVFIACIALGVLAIAGVGSVAASLADGIGSAGQVILGGDLAFSLIQREASDGERAFFDAHGTVSVVATMRAMARTGDGRSTLVEIKAVDARLSAVRHGRDRSERCRLPALFAQKDGAFGAAVDPALLTRLDLKTGDRITIGNAAIELRAALTGEPDKLAGGIGFGPRVLISEAALRATGLLQPGSLVRWQYRLRLPPADASDRAVTAVEKQAQAAFPDAGWEIRTRSKASPQLERNVERFTPIPDAGRLDHAAGRRRRRGQRGRRASGAQARRDRHHEGARRHRRRRVRHLLHRDRAGRAVRRRDRRRVLARRCRTRSPGRSAPSFRCRSRRRCIRRVLALSIVYGLLTALAFALWPLGRAHDISVSMLFRDQIAAERRWPRRRYVVATALIVAVLAALAVSTTYDHRIAAIFVAAAAGVFVMLRLRRDAHHGDRPPPAARALDRRCGSPSPTSIARAP